MIRRLTSEPIEHKIITAKSGLKYINETPPRYGRLIETNGRIEFELAAGVDGSNLEFIRNDFSRTITIRVKENYLE